MATKSVINVDLADVFSEPNRKEFLHTIAWGDYVDVEEITNTHVRIKTVRLMHIRWTNMECRHHPISFVREFS